ncbi:MAG TPA: YMGG-like glycine zipper-containing protein [Allosphingosinicella sp.]|nr:YMGG-like glycine zipper-containing protein [Allosphingosinicella sp.]
MTKTIGAILLAGTITLAGCTTYEDDRMLEGAGTGAAVGAVAGAGVGAVVGGVSPIEGALVGAAVGGLVGAVWAYRDEDGYVDGYYRDGTYYAGEPREAAEAPYQPPYRAPPPEPVRRSGERGR